MSLIIEVAINGYIVSCEDPEQEYGIKKAVFENLTDVLRFIADEHDPASRHDAKRIYVIEAPGDKHPDFTPEHAKVIWGCQAEGSTS